MRRIGDDKKARMITTILLFTGTLLALLVPVMMLVAGDSQTFSASAIVTNQAPTVAVDTGQSVSGQIATSKVVYIYFNATDKNGYSDLNDSSAQVIINKTGETSRTSSSCSVASHPDANTTRYNCSVTIWYWDADGSWTINATVSDKTPSESQNASITVDLGTLDAISIVESSLSFTGSPGTDNVPSSPEPQKINNTGNQNYGTIQVTGIDFRNTTIIGVSNVTMNRTDSNGPGDILVNNSAQTLTGGTLNKGNNSLENIYFWLDIPESTQPGTYNALSAWTISAS